MDENISHSIHALIMKIEKINNRTENKINELQIAINEYDTIIKRIDNFKGYCISEFIQQITEAKNKRKNVSRKYIHNEFLRIKEIVLFRLRHNYSLIIFNSKNN